MQKRPPKKYEVEVDKVGTKEEFQIWIPSTEKVSTLVAQYAHIHKNEWSSDFRSNRAVPLRDAKLPRNRKSAVGPCNCHLHGRDCITNYDDPNTCTNWAIGRVCTEKNCAITLMAVRTKSKTKTARALGCSNRGHLWSRIDSCEVRDTKDTHSDRGLGLFVKMGAEKINCGEYIGQYTGVIEKQRTIQKEKRSTDYCVRYEAGDEGGSYYLDATKKGSLLRFANHSHDPNCEMRSLEVDGENQVWIIARRDIVAGEEIDYNYGWKKSKFPGGKCLCRKCFGLKARYRLVEVRRRSGRPEQKEEEEKEEGTGLPTYPENFV